MRSSDNYDGSFVSIDPGSNGCGVAYWFDGIMRSAHYIRGNAFDIIKHAAEKVHRAQAVIECPQTYGGRAAKGDANDLIQLAVVVGHLQMGLSDSEATEWPTLILPQDWKRQVPKDLCAKRAMKALHGYELESVERHVPESLQHNMWDAVGIGLVCVGRLRPGLA
jgi:hypothetical protein